MLAFRISDIVWIRDVTESVVRILVISGAVAASTVVLDSQSARGSNLDEDLFSAHQRARVAYEKWDLPTAKREIDDALSLLTGKRAVENAVLEHELQRLGGDIARHSGGDAETYYRRAREALDRAEGPWIEHRIDTQSALGTLLIEKGRPDAAIALAIKTIEDVKSVLGDDANTQYFLSSYRTIAIANMIKKQFDRALVAQSQAIDSIGKPRGSAAKIDSAATDKLWFATIQLEKADFNSALDGFVAVYPKLTQGSQEQCHALAGILVIGWEPRAGEVALAAREMLDSEHDYNEMKKYLVDCLTYGFLWTTRERFWHQRFWFYRMREKIKKE